jgi:hypothetical protein
VLLTQYCSGDKIEIGGICSAYEGEGRHTEQLGKIEGKIEIGRLSDRWENNNNKMNLQKVGCGVMDRIELAHDTGI